MKISLVNMPWALVDVPSLALGILREVVTRRHPHMQVDVIHANLDYVDWIVSRREFTLADYQYLALDSYFQGIGDWVFAGALHDDPTWQADALRTAPQLTSEQIHCATDLRSLAKPFVTELIDQLITTQPDVVGFTSTFQQNVAALAAAKELKQRDPEVTIVFGGANCDDKQGAAVLRNFGFLDLVVRGEGEKAFPDLLEVLERHGRHAPHELFADIPGLCRRAPSGDILIVPMGSQPLMPQDMSRPDFRGYIDRLAASHAHDWVEPKLVVEGARGCWWGERHHCTFCGLNGSSLQFRSKAPEVFYDEVVGLVREHQVLDMFVVDNILDMGYMRTFISQLIESGHDLRLQYEIKANMKKDQLRSLVEAGVVIVQPGIENLSSRVLALMDKGVTGCLNVRMLRDAASVGLSVAWNYLYGFPGETEQDYLPLVAQFPALHHLPPLGGVTRIAIERFSPFFDRPDLGFSPLSPHPQYARNYDLPVDELTDLAYLFVGPSHGINEDVADQIRAATNRWQECYPDAVLTGTDLGDQILLRSRRVDYDWDVQWITDPAEIALFRALEQPRSLVSLAAQSFGPSGSGQLHSSTLHEILDRWLGWGVVFTEDGYYIHVVPDDTNQHLLRFDCHRSHRHTPDKDDAHRNPDAQQVAQR
ncbi:hypothetical protein KEM60_03111 [Austwickia sp. TVS 96-490-7B]|uniref:RiPP maturation radical SAM C-methyltransferase n=1 Tax=Austwickia sp. TVS 96-490-7B TaxID=2830843 RepID=UPI001C56B450|nr:RiPP maturation radical SAM C-methyltransferase [Austwickia sp. TVS 96-490-7B]MBW3086882.1 hypothetical protein [Austwickia sp. TVS 96-490-7B]